MYFQEVTIAMPLNAEPRGQRTSLGAGQNSQIHCAIAVKHQRVVNY